MITKNHFKNALAVGLFLLTSLCAMAQQSISGTVKDSNGTVTDIDGKFTLSVPSGAVVTVSCIGYKELEFTVDQRRTYNLVLEEDAESLEGVEVVAYGKQTKVTVTGALSSVKGEDLVRTPAVRCDHGAVVR